MSKKSNGNPPVPKKPYSFKKITKKILRDAKFAKFIHDQILSARDGHQVAANTVAKYFRPLSTELIALKLPISLLDHKDVNDIRCTTTHMLLDFATPAKIWRK